MRLFIKKHLGHGSHFNPKEYPYEKHYSYPLRHGLLKNGEIDWDFWCKQEFWTLDEAARLLETEKTADDSYYALATEYYQRISDGLVVLVEANAWHHMFKEKPIINKLGEGDNLANEYLRRDECHYYFISHSSLVYPRAFVEWAYHNNFFIPTALQKLLPNTIRNDKPDPCNYHNVAINKKGYTKALASISPEDWPSRRAITALLLQDLGFTARETYMALSETARSLEDAGGDPDAIVRKWRRTGRQLMEKLQSS